MDAPAPIPAPLSDDEEDVSWALSTASALWGRGERAEALKWLRRAAEHASDVNADARALQLFKAAADISTRLSNPPPANSIVVGPMTGATLPSAVARQLAAAGGRPGSVPAPPPPPPPPPKPVARVSAPPALSPRTPGPLPVAKPNHARTIPSADIEGLAKTIRREPPEPPSRASSATGRRNAQTFEAPQPERSSRTNEGRKSDAKGPGSVDDGAAGGPKPRALAGPDGTRQRSGGAIGRRRNTDSGRKRTVDERGNAPRAPEGEASVRAGAAAPSRVRVAAKGDRFDDEVTERHAVPSLGATARGGPASPRYDDLEEDTRVLEGKATQKDDALERELDHAIEQLADEDAKAAAQKDQAATLAEPDSTTSEGLEVGGSATETGFAWSHTTYDGHGGEPGPTEHAPRSPGAGVLSVAVPSTERAVPLPVLTAVRVAVLPGKAPGEARLVVLDGVGTPPAGAVHAVLVPLTSADGASIVRLLGG